MGLNNLKADLYESKGRFKDAELIRREMVKMTESKGSEWRKVKKQVMVRLKLAENLSNQGRLAEAETEMRSVLEQAAERGVGDVVFYGETAIKMANTLLRQGRLDDAEKLTMAAIPLVETSGAAKESFALSRAREFIGNIRVAKRDFKGAMEQYDSIRSDLGENEYVFTKMQRSNTNLLIAMIMTGRYETAQTISKDPMKKPFAFLARNITVQRSFWLCGGCLKPDRVTRMVRWAIFGKPFPCSWQTAP